MSVQRDVQLGALREVTVRQLHVERKVRLLYAKARTLSHAARAFLEIIDPTLVPSRGRSPSGIVLSLSLTKPHPAPGSRGGTKKPMLWTIAVILLVLWALGLVGSYTIGGFIHLLLVAAIVLVAIRLVQGRAPA